MSNTLSNTEQQCRVSENPCSAVELLLSPRETDLGGFSVRRLLPTRQRKMVGPWIFFDEMGPVSFPAGEGINVKPHPHIHLATVTYLFEGEILHRDSLGSEQPIRPGDINLMVAGRGIVHSERERPAVTATEHQLHGVQLWLALPEADEDCEPSFHHYPAHDIPSVEIGLATIRVMIGSAYGVTSTVRQFSETLYLEASLPAGESLELPATPERAVYVVEGSLQTDGVELPSKSMTVFCDQPHVSVTASENTRLVIIGGAPVGKRFIDWNFVSSNRNNIRRAREDWRHQRFEKVPGEEDEFIPLPGE